VNWKSIREGKGSLIIAPCPVLEYKHKYRSRWSGFSKKKAGDFITSPFAKTKGLLISPCKMDIYCYISHILVSPEGFHI
jgi:hypothetical protein